MSWLQQPVLQGLVTSAGSGSESVLRASRAAISRYLAGLDKDELLAMSNAFLTLLRDSYNHERLTVPILETWAFLLQTHLFDRLEQESFEYVSGLLFIMITLLTLD